MIGVKFMRPNFYQKLYSDQQGMSLVELIISIAIFTLAILSVTSIFALTLKAQRQTIASQNVQEGLRYALEMMSKEMREVGGTIGGGEAPDVLDCTDNTYPPGQTNNDNNNFYSVIEINNGDQRQVVNSNQGFDEIGTELVFRNKNQACVHYYLEDNRLKIERRFKENGSDTVSGFLTPAGIQIEELMFFAKDDGTDPYTKHPAVVVMMAAKSGQAAAYESLTRVQTTISARSFKK